MTKPVPGGPIVICEPQCAGFEHAVPNAALIATVQQAFPGHPVQVHAEQTHLEAIAEVRANSLRACAPYAEQAIRIPNRGNTAGALFAAEYRVHRDAIMAAQRAEASLLVFASVSEPGLLALRTALRLCRTRPPVLTITHGMLAKLGRAPATWSRRLFGIHRVLRGRPLPRFRLIAPGEGILREMQRIAPWAATHFEATDLPALWPPTPAARRAPAQPVCFGFLGVANRHKGFDRFVRIAQAVRRRGVSARFLLAGFAPPGAKLPEGVETVEGVGHRPLDREAFAARVAEMDYALWTGDPDHYRLTASASFLDAIGHGLPAVYLANAYIDAYAEESMGIRCASEAALVDAVCDLAREPRPEEHAQQCGAILALRTRFAPETLAPKLHAIAKKAGVQPS